MANKTETHLTESKTGIFITGDIEILTKFTPKIFHTYKQLAFERNIHACEITARSISAVGENSNGDVLQVCLKALTSTTEDTASDQKFQPFVTILKIAPKDAAHRAHCRIVELYDREVFVYQQVFKEFQILKQERLIELKNSVYGKYDTIASDNYDIVPEMLYASLDLKDEFIICKDLTLSDYKQNLRTNMPTYDLVCESFRSIAKMHAMSFILQYRKPELFKELVSKMNDNLFRSDMDYITEEFGKKHIRLTREMLEQEIKPSFKQIQALEKLENNFKEICLKCVNGKAIAPYAVICHGDFWNNNILYKYDDQQQAISAKLIDFQLSRYASPVLDLVHYLYTCTDSDLRNQHFMEFMNIYYDALIQTLKYFGHLSEEIYPKSIFLQHLQDFGIYGFCMAAFSMPFFISTASELPDLGEVYCAIKEISNGNYDKEVEIKEQASKNDTTNKCLELLEDYELLCARTLPIFKRRMFGIVNDLEKYQMIDNI